MILVRLLTEDYVKETLSGEVKENLNEKKQMIQIRSDPPLESKLKINIY